MIRTAAPLVHRFVCSLVCCTTLFAALAHSDALAPPSEHAVKAAVLLKAAKFVEWPASAFASQSASFVVCVVGAEGPLREFEALQKKQIDGRAVAVRRVTGDMLDLRQCHAAFFADGISADVDYALGKLEGAPVLTVGETEEFARRGGALALVTLEQRVHFMVNLQASKRAGLAVRSQLLQLATVIGEAKP